MSKKMRATMHNGRVHRNGAAYSAHHNDRDFDTEAAPNIVGDSARNLYKSLGQGMYFGYDKGKHPSFAEVEEQFYEQHFKADWTAQCERNAARGQKSRNKTFEQWRKSRRYCPEEQYVQIGDVAQHATEKQLVAAFSEYLQWMEKWNKEHGNPFYLLNAAVQLDETVPQVHVRRVWVYRDEQGAEHIGQEKALEQAGVDLFDPSKPEGKNNHRKRTFDQASRQAWLDCVQKAGIEVEREPLPNHRSRDKGQWLHMREKQLQEEAEKLEGERAEIASERRALRKWTDDLKEREEGLEQLSGALERQRADVVDKIQQVRAIERGARALLEELNACAHEFAESAVQLYGTLAEPEFRAEVEGYAEQYTEDERSRGEMYSARLDDLQESLSDGFDLP